jgi:hypothetical protein
LKIWKKPVCCVVVVWVTLIAEFVADTVAPETAAPDGSTTVPFKEPRVCWAGETKVHISTVKTTRPQRTTLLREQFMVTSQEVGENLFSIDVLRRLQPFVRKIHAPEG